MGSFQVHRSFFRILSLLLLIILAITMIAACDTAPIGGTNTTNTTKTTPTEPEIDGTPKGPGAANLTATARATPVTITCPKLSVSPASTSGWKTYTDTQYSFHFAYPSTWKPYVETGYSNEYPIAVFPPDTQPFPPSMGIAVGYPEYLEVTFPLVTTPPNLPQDPDWTRQSTVAIDHRQVAFYTRWSANCQGMSSTAYAEFGQYKALFFMDVELRHGSSITPAFTQQVQQDADYFLALMQSFVYTG
jgi:hypothetical protein